MRRKMRVDNKPYQRIKLFYPEGEKDTYGMIHFPENGGDATIQVGKVIYDAKDIAKTGAMVAATDSEMMKKLLQVGFKVRPAVGNATITFTVSVDAKEGIRREAEKRGTSVSNILQMLLDNYLVHTRWLEEQGEPQTDG